MTRAALSLASFFTVPGGEYANFTFTEAQGRTVTGVILALCLGILLAALYTFYQRRVPGGLVRAILKAGALSPESAKTLAELGCGKSRLIAFELRHNAMLKRLVHTVGTTDADAAAAAAAGADAAEITGATDGSDTAAVKTPVAAAAGADAAKAQPRYFIPEEDKYRADVRFDKEGNGVAGLLITAALTVLVAVLLIRLFPHLLAVIDKVLG